MAESGYWRWRFAQAGGLAEIPATAQTVFAAYVRGSAIDLTSAPFRRYRSSWAAPNDYGETQAIRSVAEAMDVVLIAYESVRDPDRGLCGAVLRPQAFTDRSPVARETWNLTILPARVLWQRDGTSLEFPAGTGHWQY